MKIRTKILLIALSLIVVTGAVSTIVGQFVTRNIVRKQIADKLETVAESRAHHIQTFLETQKEAVRQLSESIVIEEFLLTSEDDYDFVQKFDDALRRLKNTAESAEYDLDVFVLNESGIIVASSDERDIGEDKSGDPYFGGAKEGAFIKDAYVSQHRKRNSLAFSAPVFDEEDPARLGVVVTRLSMEKLNRIAACRTGLGKTGEIYLVNKEGYMLTPSRFVEDTFLKLKVDTENVRDCLEDLKRFGAEEHEHEAILCKNYLDTDIIGIHQHIPEMNWCLLAEVSEKEAFAPITSLTRLMLSILGVLLVVGIVVSILISGTITKPISKLHHGTDEVAGGNLDYKVGTGAKDEIGQLSRTFDSMTANLKESKARVEEYQKTLEERIKARTKELALANEGLMQEIEERKQAEKALQESEEKYRDLFENASDLIQSVAPDGRFIYVNRAWRETLGYDEEEVARLNMFDIIHPDSHAHCMKVFQRVVSGEAVGNVETVFVTKGGKKIVVEGTADCVFREGKPDSTRGIFRDITERRRAEETVQKIAAEWEITFNSITDLVSVHDKDFRFIRVNKAFADLYEMKPQDLVGRTCYEVVHGTEGPPADCPHKQMLESKKGVTTESFDPRLGAYLQMSASPVFEENGELAGCVHIVKDITERKRAEEVLVATTARLEHLLLSSPAVIYSCEPKGNYPPTFISENVKEQLGYEPREFVDDPKFWAEHIHPEDAPRVFAGLSYLFEQGHHIHEYRFQHKDGTYRWMRDELRLVRGADGNPLEIVGSWMDTTERKKAEEALREAEAERRRITEALREAEKLAVVGEMAGRVAHEVLNPITALLSRTQSEADCTNVTQEAVEAIKEIIADWQGNLKNGTLSEYLLEKSPGGKDTTYGEEDLAILSQAVEKNADNLKRSQEFLSFFEHHVMRVVKIIDNLRQMAQARREIEEVDVNNCLKEVAGLFQDGLDKRKITLLRRLVPGLPKVYVDRTELFQVFSNLLRNAMLAIDSKGEGGGEVAFTSELTGEEIWVRVIDNGVGVSEENKLLIFEHDFSTKSEKEGTGLGLAISRRLVREMGGELLLESSLSEGGSTFLVRLPLTKATKIAEIDTEKATAV